MIPRGLAVVVSGCAFALIACTERLELHGGTGPLAGLTALDVTPADATIAIDGVSSSPRSLAFTAIGHFADGTTRDVTSLVAWSVDDDAAGGFVGPGAFRTSNAAGGHVSVRATSGEVAGTARVTVVITERVVDGSFPPPAGGEGLFDGVVPRAGDPTHAPRLLYPIAETTFPQALAPILFQLDRGASNDVVRLSFDSDVLHLTVFTGGDRWLPDSATWALIARSHPAATATLAVDAAATSTPSIVWAGDRAPLSFSRIAPGGTISFFSSATGGIVAAAPSDPIAARLYPTKGNTCAGCHTISRDGRRMALGSGGETLAEIDLATGAATIPASKNIHMGWATFSPDGTRLLVADKGVLTLYDSDSGAPIGPGGGRVALPPNTLATHPDWSPDGSAVAVSVVTMADNQNVNGGRIALLRDDGGTWSAPEILVPGGPMQDDYFPRWSPDGHWLAYVHATGPSRDATDAELRLIAASGGAPIVLARASHRTATGDAPDLADTMPSWAPALDGTHAWLVFASARPYGRIAPAPKSSQIWAAAIDLAHTNGEADPSSPAFWLPSQDVTATSNDPIWSPRLDEAAP